MDEAAIRMNRLMAELAAQRTNCADMCANLAADIAVWEARWGDVETVSKRLAELEAKPGA